ncbi:hypothetical protein PCYB_007440, partial [Plasmodium cynomolgi strain B]
MILHIFIDNVDTFESMLKKVNNPDVCSLKRYIYECIGIYKDMNWEYCSGRNYTEDENRKSCAIINKFNELYTSFISNEGVITHDFPTLSSSTSLFVLPGCPLEGNYYDSLFDETQVGTPITQGVSGAFGAMAGISSILALLYKVFIIYIQIYEQYLII